MQWKCLLLTRLFEKMVCIQSYRCCRKLSHAEARNILINYAIKFLSKTIHYIYFTSENFFIQDVSFFLSFSSFQHVDFEESFLPLSEMVLK